MIPEILRCPLIGSAVDCCQLRNQTYEVIDQTHGRPLANGLRCRQGLTARAGRLLTAGLIKTGCCFHVLVPSNAGCHIKLLYLASCHLTCPSTTVQRPRQKPFTVSTSS